MRAAYRQQEAGPIVNIARHPRGTAFLNTGQFPKWQNSRWAADHTYSLITGISGHPEGITTAARFVVNVARNGHGFDIAGNPESPGPELVRVMPVTPGEQITVSGWFRYTGSAVQAYHYGFRPISTDGSTWLTGSTWSPFSTTLPSGAWVRITGSYKIPPGAGFVCFFIRNDNNISDGIGDTVDGTGLMVTRTPAPQANIATDPYATRTTVPNGASWGWNARWFGSGGNGTTVLVTDAADGPAGISTYLRKTWTTIGTNMSDVAYSHTWSATGNRPPVTPGESLSFSSYFRPSAGWTVTSTCRMSVEWYDASGVKIGATLQGPNLATVTANVWNRIEYLNVVAPAGAASVLIYQNVHVQSAWTVGFTLDGTSLMVTRTPPVWKFADGSSPGWKWVGAANTSESVGYPTPA